MDLLYCYLGSLYCFATVFIKKRELSKEHVETKTGIVVTDPVVLPLPQ
jgi:hypothetical protein